MVTETRSRRSRPRWFTGHIQGGTPGRSLLLPVGCCKVPTPPFYRESSSQHPSTLLVHRGAAALCLTNVMIYFIIGPFSRRVGDYRDGRGARDNKSGFSAFICFRWLVIERTKKHHYYCITITFSAAASAAAVDDEDDSECCTIHSLFFGPIDRLQAQS